MGGRPLPPPPPPPSPSPLTIPGGKPLSCVLWVPTNGRRSSSTALLLTHGASGDCTSPPLPTLAAAAADATGFPVLTFTARGPLPSRVAAFKAAAAWAGSPAALGATAVVLGGHSMGARAAAAAAAAWEEEEVDVPPPPPLPPLSALLLFSFPLHPPGQPSDAKKPDRGGLLAALPPDLPALAVRGGRDPFSSEPAWSAALAAAPPCLAHQAVAHGDHGLHGAVEAAVTAAVAWLREAVPDGAALPRKRRPSAAATARQPPKRGRRPPAAKREKT